MSRGIAPGLIAAHGLAVVALIAAVGWTHHKPYPCLTTFERVREGMTREQVEATVGGPPGNYRTAKAPMPIVGGFRVAGDAEWACDGSELLVWFTDDGRVGSVSVEPVVSLWVPGRCERGWAWLTTGYDEFSSTSVTPPYDISALWNVFSP